MAWRKRDVSWHDTSVDYCDVTGQLLPHRYWEFEAEGRTLRAASPEFEKLYKRLVALRSGAQE